MCKGMEHLSQSKTRASRPYNQAKESLLENGSNY